MENYVFNGRGQNCSDLFTANILTVSSGKVSKSTSNLEQNNESAIDHEYISSGINHSDFKTATIAYISGFVVKMTLRSLKCGKCSETLIKSGTEKKSFEQLLERKKRGNLIYASEDTLSVCVITEKIICEALMTSSLKNKNLILFLLPKILHECLKKILRSFKILTVICLTQKQLKTTSLV